MRVPYIINADFEALNQSFDKNISNSTRQIYNQNPYSYCYLVVRSDGVISKPKLYRG